MARFFAFMHLVGLVWTLSFLLHLVKAIIASTVAEWCVQLRACGGAVVGGFTASSAVYASQRSLNRYFQDRGQLGAPAAPTKPSTWKAYRRLMYSHFGTLALASVRGAQSCDRRVRGQGNAQLCIVGLTSPALGAAVCCQAVALVAVVQRPILFGLIRVRLMFSNVRRGARDIRNCLGAFILSCCCYDTSSYLDVDAAIEQLAVHGGGFAQSARRGYVPSPPAPALPWLLLTWRCELGRVGTSFGAGTSFGDATSRGCLRSRT